MNTRADIEAFLAKKRIAFVGVSRNPQDFSRRLLAELLRRGYDVVAVNPSAEAIDGLELKARVGEITPPVEAALVMTPPQASAEVVRECADAGIDLVWLHRGAGQGSVTEEAVALCKARGLTVVAGECPFMFMPRSGFPHRVHGFFRKLGGKYPS